MPILNPEEILKKKIVKGCLNEKEQLQPKKDRQIPPVY